MNFIQELADRLKAASPAWFKRLQIILGLVIAAFTAAQTAISLGYLPKLAPYTDTITGILSGLAVAFGVAFTAKKDTRTMDVVGDGERPKTPPKPKDP